MRRCLIACEFSGIVRDAFAAKGWDAWSCDSLPSERPGNHIQGDALNAILGDFDLIIAHPPCTYLCNSGVRWLAPGGKLNNARHIKMMEACDFFAKLYWAYCPRICIENPVMHHYARRYLNDEHEIGDYTQTIQPYEHGEPETKRTGLWLRGLPDLKPSNNVHLEMMNRTTAERNRVHYASPGKNRWKERSRTKPGVARAFADQWSNL